MGKLDAARSKMTQIERRTLSNLRAVLQTESDRRYFSEAGEAALWDALQSGGINPSSISDVERRISKVQQHILATVGPTRFSPGSSDPWPKNDALFEELAAFVGCKRSHIEGLHLGTVAPTVDDVILIAAYVNSDPSQMMMPTLEELSANNEVLSSTLDGRASVRAQDFALWILGLRALPFQDWQAYRSNTASSEITTPWASLRSNRYSVTALRDREQRRFPTLSAWDMLEPLECDGQDSAWVLDSSESPAWPSKGAVGLALGIRLMLRDILHASASSAEPETPTRFERRGKELTRLVRRLWHLLNDANRD